METIKLADIDKKGWKLKKEDRSHIRKVKADRAQAGVMEGIAKAMTANIQIIEKLAERMSTLPLPVMGKPQKQQPPQPVTITVPVDKTKKKFRCTPIRDETGLMLYVDIEQL
jgi:hypothetical protein